MAKAKKKNQVKSNIKDDSEINFDFIDKPRFSCAFGGALTTLTAIPGYVPIIHGGPGCGVQVQMGLTFISGFRGSAPIGGVSIPSTNTYENEIIFGGEERLEEEINTTLELIDGKQYVVLTACTPELVGDDVEGVLRKFEGKIPIAHASTAGFKGSSYVGYEILLDALIDQVVEKGRKRKKLVNVIGFVPSQDVFWEGNLIEIERLLNKLGLEVNTIFNGKDVKDLSKASLNIVLSPWVGIDAAKKLEEKFNTPYIVNNLPIGVAKTSEFLRKVGSALDIDVEELIAEEEEIAYRGIEKVADFIVDFDLQPQFATVTDSAYAIGVNDFFVKEIGWIPSLAIITEDVPQEYKNDIENQLNFGDIISPEVIFEVDTYKIWNHLKSEHLDVLFATSLDKDYANENNVAKVSVSFPITDKAVITRGYAGYRGTIAILEDSFTSIINALF
ncbi:MAG: hypothetical protein LBR24_00800 [Methanobrevibacter sp.]|nr:hypothetical protein [Methanobrevibacter sp.]